MRILFHFSKTTLLASNFPLTKSHTEMRMSTDNGYGQNSMISTTQQKMKQQQETRGLKILENGNFESVILPIAHNNSSKEAFSLPSTLVPPTVLASIYAQKSNPNSPDKGTSKTKDSSSGESNIIAESNKFQRWEESPQHALVRILESQGHDGDKRVSCNDAGYESTPSPLQLASFGTELVRAVHTSDVELLDSLLSCGLSPNPCNQFRDSILDLVCKRANDKIFLCFLSAGADVRVCDGFGRTPLHHCAWASQFSKKNAEAILERDVLQLFIEDKHGQTPMEYVRSDMAGNWIDFLESKKEIYWSRGSQPQQMKRPKDTRAEGLLPNPENAISVNLARLVSSGKIKPEDANLHKSLAFSYT